MRFALVRGLYDYWLRENQRAPGNYSVHCPLGHGNVLVGRSEADKLREQLEYANSRAARLQARVELRDRQIAARKGQITKLKKRVAAGVCPCCTRTFQDLARHMKGQHPDYTESEA